MLVLTMVPVIGGVAHADPKASLAQLFDQDLATARIGSNQTNIAIGDGRASGTISNSQLSQIYQPLISSGQYFDEQLLRMHWTGQLRLDVRNLSIGIFNWVGSYAQVGYVDFNDQYEVAQVSTLSKIDHDIYVADLKQLYKDLGEKNTIAPGPVSF